MRLKLFAPPLPFATPLKFSPPPPFDPKIKDASKPIKSPEDIKFHLSLRNRSSFKFLAPPLSKHIQHFTPNLQETPRNVNNFFTPLGFPKACK